MTLDQSRIDLSIIIPTYNRPEALTMCLDSIAGQVLPVSTTWEVLVLNDGGDSRAEDVCAAAEGRLRVPLVYHRSDHVGPGAIRNKAIAMSRGRVLLILNDDVTLRPGHLQRHLARHAAHPGHAARGMTVWARECVASDFMAWAMRQSFFYYLIDDFDACGYEYWHTCDLSIDRTWVEGPRAILFNEQFPHAGYEDTEWGWRLERAGCRLAFLPETITDHHHVYTPEGLAERGRRNGASGAILFDLVPELANRAILDFLEQKVVPSRNVLWRMATRALGLISGEQPTPQEAQIEAWQQTFISAYIEGFQEEYTKRHGYPFEPGD